MNVKITIVTVGLLFFSACIDAKIDFFCILSNKAKQFNNRIPFPTQANRIDRIAGDNKKKQRKIVNQANNVRPIIYAPVMNMIRKFIALKKEYGTSIEQKFYASMSESEFINRLLAKRPLMFMTKADTYVLRNGQKGYGGFDTIGTIQQKSPLILEDYLSYDEMQIAALLGRCGPRYTASIVCGPRSGASCTLPLLTTRELIY